VAKIVFTGWREVTPSMCGYCGSSDNWQCDGRGNILCDCQACPDCGIIDSYGFHNPDCSRLEKEESEG
jgi:hypothetical protein